MTMLLITNLKTKRSSLVVIGFVLLFLSCPLAVEGKKAQHPFDLFNHEMHTAMFEGVVSCETCHADPASFTNRDKINRLGCHVCHNSDNPPLPASNDCSRCHPDGKIPKPQDHKADWKAKHQIFAKQNPESCAQCHSDPMFCINCHQRRDDVQEEMHRRNFRYVHSIEARANPRRCDACHSISYCQQCHSGKEDL